MLFRSRIYESDDYNIIKDKFEKISRSGYRHILFWIISPDFYQEYLNDTNKMKGKRILLCPIPEDLDIINRTMVSFLGYECILSNNFTMKYGINYILLSGLDDENKALLKQRTDLYFKK